MQYTEDYGWARCFLRASRVTHHKDFPKDVTEIFAIGFGSLEQGKITVFFYVQFKRHEGKVRPELLVPQEAWNILHSMKLLDYLARIPGDPALKPEDMLGIFKRLGFEDWTAKANEP